MDSQRWDRIKKLFEQAIELQPKDRIIFLERECNDDDDLKATVLKMIESDQQADTFLEKPATITSVINKAVTMHDTRIGTRIGGYTLVEILGEGGMGTVYRAEKADHTFHRIVALKIVKHGMGSRTIVHRFYTERRILANLDHPNIARLIDGGMTDDGLPYFIMEYVNGKPLTEYCDENQISIKKRLELFTNVCDAVHYAHKNLIIHRDLKPSNILVTSDGTVKLLDFGIAKLLTPDGASAPATITSGNFPVMTPEYASPEQIRGEQITTASDVYSLGIILYELLSGCRPYEFTARTPIEIERTIRHKDTTKPSTHLISKKDDQKTLNTICNARSTSIDRLRRELSGDIDNIVMMAIRKEPERRYKSADQLLNDINRYDNNLPVAARSETLLYNTSKFIRRHTYGVAATITVILALAIGILIALNQAHIANVERQKAQDRFNDVRNLANTLIFDFHDVIVDLPGSTGARELLVSMGLEYLNNLATDMHDDPEFLQELSAAYQRIGDVQGNPTNANLGDTDGALESYEMALSLVRKLVSEQPNSISAQLTLARNLRRLSDLQAWIGNINDAIEAVLESQEIIASLAQEEPDNPELQRDHAISYIKLGDYSGNPHFPNLGNTGTALQYYLQARNILNRVYNIDNTDMFTRRFVGLIHERIGTIEVLHGNNDAAISAYEQSLHIRQSLEADYNTHTDIIRDLAVAYEKLGNIYIATGNPDAATEYLSQSMQIFKQLVDADPNNFQAQLSLSISYIHLADAIRSGTSEHTGTDDALSYFHQSQHILQQLHEIDPESTRVNHLLDLVQRRIREMTG